MKVHIGYGSEKCLLPLYTRNKNFQLKCELIIDKNEIIEIMKEVVPDLQYEFTDVNDKLDMLGGPEEKSSIMISLHSIRDNFIT